MNIPLESGLYSHSVCWFSNSESFVLASSKKFQTFNILVDPYKPALNIDIDLENDKSRPPKLALIDRILILLNQDYKLIFYDLLR